MAQHQLIRAGSKTATKTGAKPGGDGASGPGAGQREIPDKLYFRIGEVARLCEVPAYVLRFWESEFPQLKPNKGGTGQRLYRRRDVEMALRVKTLLYDEGYTIPGARQMLKSELKPKDPLPLLPEIDAIPDLQRLKRLRKEMQELLAMLQVPVGEKKTAAVQSIRAVKSRRGVVEMESGGLFGPPEPSPEAPF
jgi:DNA-binding transcriptional MerR regulator